MKVQRARFRIIALIMLCAFALVIILFLRAMHDFPEAAEIMDAGDQAANEEYDEQTQMETDDGPEATEKPVETVPPAEPMDTFGL